jgi:hypothetical protein
MIDWVMSLEPDWASTIYGAMLIVGQGLVAFAFSVGVISLQIRDRSMPIIVARETLGDLGNLLLAFIMLWAYMAFSQFLIIWSGNLPEEISWYVRRTRGGWQWVAGLLIVFHFFAPFFVLMFHEAKRRAGVLLAIAMTVVALHFVDLCWLVLPSRYEPRASHIPWDEVGLALLATLGIGGVFVATLVTSLGREPVPSPVREEERP